MTRLVTGLALALAVVAIPSTAAAAPASLPAVKRALSVSAAKSAACSTQRSASQRGVAAASYRAPMSGFVRATLAAPNSSDWDLALFDAASHRRHATSQEFGSHEVADTWVTAGPRLRVQGCLRSGTARHAAVSLRFFDVAVPKWDGVSKLVTVFFNDGRELNALEAAGLDVTHDVHPGQAEVAVYSSKELALLNKLTERYGLKTQTKIADLAADSARAREADARYSASTAASPLPTGRTTYRQLEDYQNELKKIVATYGGRDLAKPVNIGKTFEGRDIQGVELSSGVSRTDDGKPTYILVGMHHAREWSSAESAMEFAWMLVKGYGSNERITKLLDNERVVVIPILNVDGFVVSRRDSAFSPNDIGNENGIFTPGSDPGETVHTGEAVTPGGPPFAYRRKNCDGEFPQAASQGGAPCELQHGVDPNRNYGNGWGGNGASSDPTSQSYRGSGPWSEPETQAFWHFSQNRNVTALITLHNVAALVLRPPGLSSSGFAPDEDAMKKLGDEMADDTGYTSQFSWQLYDTSGTTEDWNYAAQGAFGYTIEIGPEGGQFHEPYQQGMVDEWTGHGGKRPGLKEALIRGAEAGYSDSVTGTVRGHAPAGSVLHLRKTFKTSTSPLCKFSDPLVLSNMCEGPDNTASGPSQQIPDKLDYKMTVPASGEYSWKVGPSTRPFVAEKRELGKQTKLGEQKWDGTMPVDGSRQVVPFTVKDSSIFRMTIDLSWDPECASDLDLYIYWKDPVTHEFRQVASSGNTAGSCEQAVLIQPRPGEYKAEIDLFASPPATPWHLVRQDYAGDIKITRTGKTEAYTMTCERDGKVLETKQVTVFRGQTVDADCGVPPAQAVLGVKKKHKVSKRAACLRKAKKVHGKKRRARAVKRCNKRYGTHHKAKRHSKHR